MDGGEELMMAFPENVQELVSVAATYALDGAPFTAADRLHKAADALKMSAISRRAIRSQKPCAKIGGLFQHY